ncbi:MAG: hypothetical protein AAGF57_18635 [Pseudomonadota bacterium]
MKRHKLKLTTLFHAAIAILLCNSVAFTQIASADDEVAALVVDNGSGMLKFDPPIFMTNLTGLPATIVWQTLVPNRALTPQRGTLVAADADSTQSEEGFFILYDRDQPNEINNVLFISILGEDDSLVTQELMVIDENVDLKHLHQKGIEIVVTADGSLSVSRRE